MIKLINTIFLLARGYTWHSKILHKQFFYVKQFHKNSRRRKETYSIQLILLSPGLGFVMRNPQKLDEFQPSTIAHSIIQMLSREAPYCLLLLNDIVISGQMQQLSCER